MRYSRMLTRAMCQSAEQQSDSDDREGAMRSFIMHNSLATSVCEAKHGHSKGREIAIGFIDCVLAQCGKSLEFSRIYTNTQILPNQSTVRGYVLVDVSGELRA